MERETKKAERVSSCRHHSRKWETKLIMGGLPHGLEGWWMMLGEGDR